MTATMRDAAAVAYDKAARAFRRNPGRQFVAVQVGDHIHQFRRTEVGDILPAGRWLAATGNERESPSWDAGR